MNKQNILNGASAALIAAGIFCTSFVTERAEIVSRETITPQTEQQAAEDQQEELAEVEPVRLYTDADAVALAHFGTQAHPFTFTPSSSRPSTTR